MLRKRMRPESSQPSAVALSSCAAKRKSKDDDDHRKRRGLQVYDAHGSPSSAISSSPSSTADTKSTMPEEPFFRYDDDIARNAALTVRDAVRDCVTDGKFLVGNTSLNVSRDSMSMDHAILISPTAARTPCPKPLENPTRGWYLTKSTTYFVCGPFRTPEDYREIAHLLSVIRVLHAIKRFHEDTWEHRYKSMSLLVQSVNETNRLWLLYGYGGGRRVCPVSQTMTDKYAPEWLLHILVNLMLKAMVGSGARNTLDYLVSDGCSRKVLPFGLECLDGSRIELDESSPSPPPSSSSHVSTATASGPNILHKMCSSRVDDARQLRQFQELECNLQLIAPQCIEIMELWRVRIQSTLGDTSYECRWWTRTQAQVRVHLFPSAVDANPSKYGWPLTAQQRVMFRYSRMAGREFPATVKESRETHVPFEKSSYESPGTELIIDDEVRSHVPFACRHFDVHTMDAVNIRPMTAEEQLKYPVPSSSSSSSSPYPDNFARHNSAQAFYCGDIVKIYDMPDTFHSVVKEDPHTHAVIVDVDAAQRIPADIGLVLNDEGNNPYWKLVYCWKTKKTRSISCRHLYWVADTHRNGRALRIADAEQQLDTLTPRQLLTMHVTAFDPFVVAKS